MAQVDTQISPASHLIVTNELARIVGLIAQHHRDCAVQIEWFAGADEREWLVTATNGCEDHVYIVDDEAGVWAPALPSDIARARPEA